MTAEIAVLNRNAIALAADSAVTLQLPEGTKIYHTNKLFTLSKYRPVGIMIYGSADFMRVPWETLIKNFRQQLQNRGFDHLQGYADAFLRFVERNSSYFPVSVQRAFCYEWALHWSHTLRLKFTKAVEEKLKSGKAVSAKQARGMFKSILRDEIRHLRMHRHLPRFSRRRSAAIPRYFRIPLRRAIRDQLQQLAFPTIFQQLENACALAFVKDLYWFGESGIVVAGYGEKDIFPSLRCYKLDGIIGTRLRMIEERGKKCDISNTTGDSAAVIAFAQSEMVSLFMNGIDDDYAQFVHAFIANSLLQGYPSVISKLISSRVSQSIRSKIAQMLTKVGRQLTESLTKDLRQYAKAMHSDPIVEIVNHLPTLELAGIAEALVNLTSFKRHVTRQAETVGGPIDVAVISRGDGFIWIKRKHYFTKELNPQFLANYYR